MATPAWALPWLPRGSSESSFRAGGLMKCQKCDKLATFHITEVTGSELTEGKPLELHLCEEHARSYLTESDAEEEGGSSLLKGQLAVGQTVEELARLDQQSCPICGITFYEFRNQGRLGCPHDYICFEKELDPLIVNIHGENEHAGKHPKRSGANTSRQTELIRLRRELKEAVSAEEYERASQLRDEIKQIEGSN